MGKIAVVTGVSRGIGLAITKRLVELGFCVIGLCRGEIVKDLKDLLAKNGGAGFSVDISKPETVSQWFEQLPPIWQKVDLLVNNAGVCQDSLVLRMSNEAWHKVLDTNLSGTFYLTKLFLRGMLKQRQGRIISLSSVVALGGNLGQANYAAAKAGIIAFSKSLAQEVAGRNITVNCIAPGFIESEMTQALTDEQRKNILERIPMRRVGTPEDVVNAVEFLANEKSGYITGTVLHVNGGLTMI